MELTVKSMLFLSVLTTVMMIVISLITYTSEKEKRYIPSLEFWVSYGAYFLLAFILEGQPPKIYSIAIIAWIWRARAIRLILEEISGSSLYRPWHMIMICTMYPLCVVFAVLDLPFTVYTFPAGFSIFVLGCDYIFQTTKIFQKRKVATVHYMLLVTMGFIFIHTLNYCFLRINPGFAPFGFGLALLTTILMAILVPTVTIYQLQRDQSSNLEQMVEERTQKLVIQSKMSALGEMAAGVAHEINNPLGIISGRAFQLRRDLLNNESIEMNKIDTGLIQIETTADKISKTIKSLRNFARDSRLDSMKKTELKEIISETLGLCKERFKHMNIEMIVDEIPAIAIDCRSIQISQVLLNILNNSFDAISLNEKKWIHIGFTDNQEKITIGVTDSGVGVPIDLQKKLMQPFFTTKRESNRPGLGLSISHEIIAEHKGKFFYDSSSMNTRFVIELPKLGV